ncbi:MAG TPA: deoxyguanosinetriphosphate triphosphohydrolase [Saprospirales bacterium]|nr:deoxyguanosinetriphosphate triphosphohydrolase [Saprospirales bacterium]
MMEWKKLLSPERLGQKRSMTNDSVHYRSDFQVDYDRIIFSSSFRKLQNKTQVFPFPKSDFVRNRLTHSLETASVGRTLGNMAGQLLFKKYPQLNDSCQPSDLGALTSAACLAHDIGNPPFGHAGEDAISSYFKSKAAMPYIAGLNVVQKADLQNFEGNAAGFRIMTHTAPYHSNLEGGLGLSFATYASFIKYPRPSYPFPDIHDRVSLKKYNFFWSEIPVYDKISAELGITQYKTGELQVNHRFPLAFLVEAADDICYSIIDFEDGYHVHLISFEEIESAYFEILNREQFDLGRYNQLNSRETKIAYLRSKAINEMVQQTAKVFIEKEEDIRAGIFDTALIEKTPQIHTLKQIKKTSFEKIYNSETVLKIESAGRKVLPGLLEIFVQSVMSDEDKFLAKLRKLIPQEYLDINHQPFEERYTNLLNIAMFVSGMTDQQAVRMYRDLFGISLADY